MDAAPFRKLVDRARRRGLPPDAPSRTIATTAAACGVSRVYFHALMRGERMPRPDTIEGLARGLGVTVETTRRALAATVSEALT
jgi:transcriptional regulator with XRE-family HTH domain